MTRRVGVVRFPGTNCEFDTIDAIRMLGGDAEILWHGDPSLKNVDAIVILLIPQTFRKLDKTKHGIQKQQLKR